MKQKYFITGASGGLGLAITKAALTEGHTVVAAVRKSSSMEELKKEYPNLIVEQLDVTDLESIANVVNSHLDSDVVINNAGGAILGAMEELSDTQVDQQLILNLMAPINITRLVLPAMRARKSGTLVYITSMGGRVAFAGGAMYHAAKFGLEGFAEAVSQEVAEFGVRTLIFEPGSMKTNFIGNLTWAEQMDDYKDSVVGQMRAYIKATGDENISGDPDKMAQVIIQRIDDGQAPLRTALGIDAYDVLATGYAKHVEELVAQEEVAKSVAIEGKTGFIPEV